MFNFKRGGKRFGNQGYGDRDEGPQLFQTVCDGCGDECEVPFKPNGKKPVFCRACFKKNSPEEGGFERREKREPRGGFDKGPRREDKPDYKQQFEMLSFKMDMVLKALHQLTEVMAAKSHTKIAPEEAAPTETLEGFVKKAKKKAAKKA
jgi:CxxC-x17-CxxC domain-containing protein